MQRAVQYEETGSPSVLRLTDVAVPEPADGRVVVTVRAVGLNPFDGKVRAGLIPTKAAFPRGIGGDFSGVVSAVGTNAEYVDGTPVAIGDEVLGWAASTLREQLAVASTHLVRKPANVSFAVAGSLSTPGQTAAAALRTVPIGESDTVLVSSASGSVGFLTAQLALTAGARVIGTASLSNHERLRAAGIVPVTYGAGLAERLRAAAPEGISAVLDSAGRETIDAALALGVAPERINTIVDYAAVDEFGIRTPGQYERRADVLDDLVRRVSAGTLELPVQQEFALDDVVAAFTLMESRHLTGKVVVTP